jgi:hypothetical protein
MDNAAPTLKIDSTSNSTFRAAIHAFQECSLGLYRLVWANGFAVADSIDRPLDRPKAHSP